MAFLLIRRNHLYQAGTGAGAQYITIGGQQITIGGVPITIGGVSG